MIEQIAHELIKQGLTYISATETKLLTYREIDGKYLVFVAKQDKEGFTTGWDVKPKVYCSEKSAKKFLED